VRLYVFLHARYYPNFEYYGDENPDTANFSRDVTGVDPSMLVEIVTYPNNPDGVYYPPLHPTAKYHIFE
jgi:hypothetical protein